MSDQVYECRWADCHREFNEVDRYKEHIDSHVETHQPMLVRDIPDFRRAAGFGLGVLRLGDPLLYTLY